jgi:hypothetical protein
LSGETARMLWIIVGLSLALAKLVEQHQRSHPAPS